MISGPTSVVGFSGIACAQGGEPVFDLLDERVTGRSDCDYYGDCHATLSCRTVASRHSRVRCKVEVGVWQHHHMVFASAERLDALVAADASDTNRFRDGRGANKADTCNVGMLDQTVNDCLATEHDVERTLRKSSAEKYLGDAERGRWITITWLEDYGVAASKRHCALYDRDQHREVKGADRHDHSNWKANLHRVDATRYARAERAAIPAADRGQLAQHLDGPIDLGTGIGKCLAQLGNDDIDEFITGGPKRRAQFEHHGRAILQALCGPGRKRCTGGSDSPIDLIRRRDRRDGGRRPT